MPLSKFPETFRLNLTTHSKGDFPFKFNISDNQNYIGPMPGIEFYATNTKNLLPGMTISQRNGRGSFLLLYHRRFNDGCLPF